MATQAQTFVPSAIEKARAIKNQMIALQSAAASLKAEFQSLGGENMGGYVAFDWANYPFTQAEFTAGMNDLTTAHNAVALSTIYSLLAYDDVTKLAIG